MRHFVLATLLALPGVAMLTPAPGVAERNESRPATVASAPQTPVALPTPAIPRAGAGSPAVAPARGLEGRALPSAASSAPHPVFLQPTTATTGPLRVGLSAWTTPAVPADTRDASAGIAVGLTIAWPAWGATPRQPQP